MADFFFHTDDLYVLIYCGKYLGRFNTDRRHSYGDAEVPRDHIAEAWRFPIVDSYGGGAPSVTTSAGFQEYNQVTFIYAGADKLSPSSVAVIGTFATLYDPQLLRRVQFEGENTRYWAI